MKEEVRGEQVRAMNLRREKPPIFTGKDICLACAMFGIGFLYWHWIWSSALSLGVTLFAPVFCLVAGVYMNALGYRQTRKSIPYLLLLLGVALPFTLFDNDFLELLNLILLTLLAVYWITVTTGRQIVFGLSGYLLGDFFNQLLVVPFSNFFCAFGALSGGILKNKRGKSVMAAVLGLFLFAPVLILVLSLLGDADAAFAMVLAGLKISLSQNVWEYLLQFFFGIPVCCYLYGLVYGNVQGRCLDTITKESVDRFAWGLRFAPKAAVYAALSALNLIYVSFFVTQGAYLFSAFGSVLPEAMTYAQYARRGFFELCTVAGINLAVLSVAYLILNREESTEKNGEEKGPKKRQGEPMGLKWEAVALVLLTILLLATALSKMVLYIHCYGLTLLRVYTTWFMLLLLAFLVIILIRRFIAFPAGKAMVVSFLVLFMILVYGNVDGMIAKYNIERYQLSGEAYSDMEKASMVEELSRLSDGAGGYLCDLYQETEDVQLKELIFRAVKSDFSLRQWREDPDYRRYNRQTELYFKQATEITENH